MFLTTQLHKKYDCVSSKETWTSALRKVTSWNTSQSSSLRRAEIKIQKSFTFLLFLNFLNICSNTVQCSTRLWLDVQCSGDIVYQRLQMLTIKFKAFGQSCLLAKSPRELRQSISNQGARGDVL